MVRSRHGLGRETRRALPVNRRGESIVLVDGTQPFLTGFLADSERKKHFPGGVFKKGLSDCRRSVKRELRGVRGRDISPFPYIQEADEALPREPFLGHPAAGGSITGMTSSAALGIREGIVPPPREGESAGREGRTTDQYWLH